MAVVTHGSRAKECLQQQNAFALKHSHRTETNNFSSSLWNGMLTMPLKCTLVLFIKYDI